MGLRMMGLFLGVPSCPELPRAAQSRQARPEEAQEPSWGTAKEGTLTVLARGSGGLGSGGGLAGTAGASAGGGLRSWVCGAWVAEWTCGCV